MERGKATFLRKNGIINSAAFLSHFSIFCNPHGPCINFGLSASSNSLIPREETFKASNFPKYYIFAPAWRIYSFEVLTLFPSASANWRTAKEKNHAPSDFKVTLKNSCFEVSEKWQRLLLQHFLFQEFSGANVEPKAWSFRETKSFGVSFSQNRAGVLRAPERCLGGGMPLLEKKLLALRFLTLPLATVSWKYFSFSFSGCRRPASPSLGG